LAGRWSDLSPRTRRLIIVAGVAETLLKAAVLIDLRHRPAAEIRGRKKVWAASMTVNSFGVMPLSYFVFGRRHQGRFGGGERPVELPG
jgi:hypothetical protein